MSLAIPLNPVVLKWARKTSGYSKEEVIRKLKRKTISIATLEDWETGISSPTYSQLEKLAYEIYKRPIALFFFPSPPKEETPEKSFRTLPEFEILNIEPHLLYIIKQAHIMKLNLAELYDNQNYNAEKMFSILDFDTSTPLEKMVSNVRDYFKINISDQKQWKNAEDGFKHWRNVFEKNGIFVFKDAFKNDSISGFCLYDDIFPIIYVNNSKPFTRQIFTLFHELAHLLMKTGGIDKSEDDYFKYLEGNNYKIEMLCNNFAGEFLVPHDDFDVKIKSIKTNEINNSLIGILAKEYKVSREVILRKFLNAGKINQAEYNQYTSSWYKNGTKRKRGSGGDFYKTKGVYLGDNYLNVVFTKYYQNQISSNQAANYLNIKPKNFSGMEQLVLEKGGAA